MTGRAPASRSPRTEVWQPQTCLGWPTQADDSSGKLPAKINWWLFRNRDDLVVPLASGRSRSQATRRPLTATWRRASSPTAVCRWTCCALAARAAALHRACRRREHPAGGRQQRHVRLGWTATVFAYQRMPRTWQSCRPTASTPRRHADTGRYDIHSSSGSTLLIAMQATGY